MQYTHYGGGDTGAVSITITGKGFEKGAIATLSNSLQQINAKSISVSGDGNTLLSTFDLTGSTRGSWDVLVTNPDGSSFALPEAFTVEEGRAAQVWVDIIGRNTIRSGRAQQFNILYGNRGNVDALLVQLLIAGIPKDAQVITKIDAFVLPNSITVEKPDPAPIVEIEQEKVIPVFIPLVPAGFTGILGVEITSTPGFELRVLEASP